MSTRTLSCTHCSSPCREHSFKTLGNKNDPVSISDDIERLDQTIHRLRILKSQRCRQLNTIRSTTRTLPNEILLSIFHIFCSSFKSEHLLPQFILGGVCSHWRNLINGEPLFWRTISLHVEDRNISKAVSLFKLFKRRNGASFELMQLDFEKLRDQTSLYQQLSPSISRVSTLSRIALCNPPVDLLRIINDGLNPHDMSLTGPKSYNPVPEFVPSFSLPWLALTNLTLSRIQVDICCELLLGCPNLIAFSSHDSLAPTDDNVQPNTHHARETHFPHLQHLTWHHNDTRWDNHFLSFYRFPALQYFCWRGRKHDYGFLLFHTFTTFLPQACRTFHLAAPKSGAPLDIEILQQVAYPVEQLICSYIHMDDLARALESLEDPTFMPSLTVFRWEGYCHDDLESEIYFEIISCFKYAIRCRKKISAGRFRMEIEGMRLPEGWSKESIFEFRMGGGFDYEIDKDDRWIISF